MSFIQDKIKEASQKYYTDGTSDLSDAEFDNMLEQLKEEDPDSPLLTDVGHGYDVNKDTTYGQKFKHRYGEAGSLNKCHNYKELAIGLKEKSGLWASLKLDGLSVVLHYENGDLARALTRGDGITGIDITDKVRYIYNDFTQLYDEYFTGAVRAEILMSHKNFEQFQEKHPEAKNPRNSTAGLINAKELSEDLQLLDIVAYRVVGRNAPNLQETTATYTDMIYWLVTNFPNNAPFEKVYLNDSNFMSEMERLRDQWYSNYPADGVVLTDDEIQMLDKENDDIELVYNSNAFKFKAESAVTTVLDIEWNLSKTKYLIPKIKLDTVELSGTNVSYCAGNNAQFIKVNGIGKGAKVEVLKSGEIIPYLENVVEPADVELPTHCPCCGTELAMSGVHLVCPNMECADSDIKDLLVWMNTIAPYDGLGDILKLKFLESDLGLNNISIDGLYRRGRQTYISTISSQYNAFQKMYDMLFTNEVKLADAIKALNIPRFGDVTSSKLAEYPEYVNYLIDCALSGEEDIADMSNEIGKANFKSLLDNVYKFKRLVWIRDNILFEKPRTVQVKGKVAITGKLSVKRSVFEDELRAAGYIPGNISKDTDYLITDKPDSASDKNKKADEWGITKIRECDFREKYMNR